MSKEDHSAAIAQDVRRGLTSEDIRDEIITKVGMMADARTEEMQARYDAALEREGKQDSPEGPIPKKAGEKPLVDTYGLDEQRAAIARQDLHMKESFHGKTKDSPKEPVPLVDGCDLCEDNHAPGPLHLHARCHMTAPLQVSIEGHILTLRCYLPECGRIVTRMRVTEIL